MPMPGCWVTVWDTSGLAVNEPGPSVPRSDPLMAPRGPRGCFFTRSDVVVVQEELSPGVHASSIFGLDVNQAPNNTK
jgi:hypothetical protein